MGDTSFFHFPGNLDPAAEEFFPIARRPVPVYIPIPQHHHFALPLQTTVSLPPPRSMPSRALLLSMVPADVSESTVRRELEVFGDVRAVQMERLRDGMVTVHFYDLRQAQAALVEIQDQHMQQQYRVRMQHDAVLVHASLNFAVFVPSSPAPPPAARGLIAGRTVWAQFTAPLISSLPDGTNQGTLAVFNLEPLVSPAMLQQIFEEFGHVREIREAPERKSQRFVEFYDVREASRALIEMNHKEIHGRRIGIEFSPPGGHYRKFHPKRSFNPNKWSPELHTRHHSGRVADDPPAYRPTGLLLRQKGTQQLRGSVSQFSSNSSGGYAATSMASLNLSGGPRMKKKMGSCSPPTTATTNGTTISSSDGSTSKIQHGRQSKVSYASSNIDSRTTVMIKNIPNRYSQKLLLNMLDNHCLDCNKLIGDRDDDTQALSSYDFVYLPIDFMTKCNLGYGFVNMTSPEATLQLYNAFHGQSWELFDSRKICDITYARLQGLEALKKHFKNSKFPYEVEEFMPVEFSPPRDGRRLTEPAVLSVQIVGPRIKCLPSSFEEGNNMGQ